MRLCSAMSRDWKTTVKTVVGIFSLFAMVLIAPRPVAAIQTALVRASDGNVYQIRFPNEDLSGGYSLSNFIDDFSIYNETGQVELCPGNNQSVTRELYTAARVLAQTPRNTPLFDTSPLAATLEQTAAELGIDQKGNVDVVGIVGDIVKEMAVDELQGQIQTVVDPSLNLGIATINLNTLKIKINASGPDIIVKPTEFLSELVGLEIELRWMLYAFSRASTYANTTIHLQALANQRAAALWDAINAGEVVDITGHAFTIHEDAIEISNAIGVFDPLRLRLAAGVYRAYAEYVAELGTNLAEHEGPVATLANRISVDIITEFLFTLSDAQSAMAEKDALDELDARIPGDINTRLHANINGIYDSATSDLNQNGFCAPDLRFAAVPLTVPEGDTLTYTVALNSAPGFLAIISISSDNPDVTVSPTSLTFTASNWYIPKRVGVDVSEDADSIDESVSLRHIVAGYGGGMVREFQFDITDQVSNRAPEAIRTIPDQTLTVGDSSAPLDLPTYFHDPDDDLLTYTVVSSDPNVATAQRVGSQLTIWTLNVGNTTVTVRATDPDGLFITQTFSVIVTANETPTERPTAQGLSNGDAIIVQNTGSDGLDIRSAPQVRNQNPDNRIGLVYDGAMGTITAGPRESDGYIWWEVQWDASNNRGWSVESIGEVGLLARRPPEPVTHSFDLEIQPLTVSKQTLDAGESFTLSITIHNNGPGNSPGPALSYYHSLSPGFSPTDPPQLQGTLSLGPLASDESITQSIQLVAPSTPKTYYYGAWLAANTGDTYLNNDVATEIAVTVSGDTHPDPVDTSDPPDLVITNISVDYDTMYPEERFTVSATVQNAGGKRASNVRLRFYRSSDATYSQDDVEFEDVSEFVGGLDADEAKPEDAHFDAPSEPGDYYYIVRAEPVRNEVDTDNNYAAIEITVLPPAAPDLVVSLLVPIWGRGKITSRPGNEYFIDPDEFFRLEATINNQGAAEAEATSIHFYRSLDPIPSPERDEFIETKELREFRDPDSRFYDPREQWSRILAPEKPGTYYYYACVDSVPGERYTDNNCSNVVTLNVRGPDLVVSTVEVDYVSRLETVRPGSFFRLEGVTVTNQGTDRAWQDGDLLIRYYVSSDATFSKQTDTQVDTDRFFRSLKIGETSKTVKSENIPVPYPSGVFYCFVCVDAVEDESDTTNNCFGPIEIRVRNVAPRAQGTIPAQTLSTGTSAALEVSAYFADTNNDTLTYTASSSDSNIATVRVSGPQVTLIPQRTGSVNVTITASDGQATATQTFSVSVTETKTPDLVVESVGADKNTVDPGETFQLNAVIKNQGEAASIATPLRYYLSTDTTISDTDTQVYATILPMVAASANGEPSVELTAPNTPGTYYYGVCIDAVEGESDTTNNCSTSVAITVKNRAPSAVGTLPSRTLSEDSTPVAVDVAEYFNDPDNTALTYTAVSDNTTVVLAQMRGSEVAITPIGAGDAMVTVTASDGELTATQTLSVSVVATPTENEAPVAIDVIPAQSLTVDGAASTVDISAYFSDANGDTLTYAAWPDDKNVLGLRREGTLLTITPKAAGSATVTVRARDPEGLQAFQSISVFVSTTEIPVTDVPAETWMPDANLRAAVRDALGLAPNDALTQQAIQGLTSLRYLGPDLSDNQKITDLTGLEYALNLEHLDLYMHLISDLRPLEKLAKLRSVWLAGNKISNIRPLTSLPLERLDLGGNPITDFTPLAELTSLTRLDFWGNGLGDNNLHLITGLTQLTQLDLRNNQISNITSLTKLVNLKKLQLKGNPISDTSPLLDLISQNPNLEIDIEISDEPPSEPDTEIEAEVPDLVVESVRVNKTAVDPGAVFRLTALIKNQGQAASGAATVRFYRSQDATISVEDTQVNRSPLPLVATDATRNKWARITAPKTAGVYYYGVCIEGVADESDTENNCSTAVKMTVGTVPVKPPVVETPPTTVPETDEGPAQGTALAKQVFDKHGKILRRRDVKEVLPNVLTTLKEPDIQALLNPATINLVIADPDILKTMVPTISDKFITLMKTDAAIKALLSDAQVQTLLQMPAAIDELSKLLGISVAPPSTVGGTVVFRDANLAKKVREALNLPAGAAIPQAKLATLTHLDAQHFGVLGEDSYISDLTGLEHATGLRILLINTNKSSYITPLAGLTELESLTLTGSRISDLRPLSGLTKLKRLHIYVNNISNLQRYVDFTQLEFLGVDRSQVSNSQINDPSLLKDLRGIKRLSLSSNSISDITPLAQLTQLQDLFLPSNQISDITPLAQLTQLEGLSLSFNQISDITPLSRLTGLKFLHIRHNQIRDITPIEGLISLNSLWIDRNPIDDLAPLHRLKAKNPNMKINPGINTGAAPSAPVIPEETALLPNYPNPFNPETWIPYQLAKSADVTVTIYDVRGVVVRRLALGHQTAGFYQSRAHAAHWDGRNQLGEKVASGLYFYTFTAGEFTAIGKMLIQK